MSHSSRWFTAALLLVAPATPALAQLTEVAPGARVRIQAPGIVAGRYEGTVIARTRDSLTLASSATPPVTIAAARITSLEISRGSSRTDGAMRGLAWSVPIGVGLGLAFLPGLHDCTTCGNKPSDVGVVLQMAIGSAMWGAGIGAIVGRERWESFDLAPKLSLTTQGGPGVRMTLSF